MEFFKNEIVSSFYPMYSKDEYHESDIGDSYTGCKVEVHDIQVSKNSVSPWKIIITTASFFSKHYDILKIRCQWENASGC